MREYKLLPMHNAEVTTTDAASGEVDLAPYINVGRRECKASLAIHVSATDTTTDLVVDYVIQESDTTASSDFADIVGANFAQVLFAGLPSVEVIHFTPYKQHVRGLSSIEGTTPKVSLVSSILAIARATT